MLTNGKGKGQEMRQLKRNQCQQVLNYCAAHATFERFNYLTCRLQNRVQAWSYRPRRNVPGSNEKFGKSEDSWESEARTTAAKPAEACNAKRDMKRVG